MTSKVRGISRNARSAADRLLRPVRRARIARTLACLPQAPSFLVVCLGNVCRSPYAAHRLREGFRVRGRSDIQIESAGLALPGRPSPASARIAARRRGLDLDQHVSQPVGTELLRKADVVFVMSGRQKKQLRNRFGCVAPILLLGDADPHQHMPRAIKDPFERPERVYAVAYDRLDRCCLAIADWMSAAHARPGARCETEKADDPADLRGKQPEETVDHAGRGDDGRPKAAAG